MIFYYTLVNPWIVAVINEINLNTVYLINSYGLGSFDLLDLTNAFKLRFHFF